MRRGAPRSGGFATPLARPRHDVHPSLRLTTLRSRRLTAIAAALLVAAWQGHGIAAGTPPADAGRLAARRAELKAKVEAIQRELAAAESFRADATEALRTSALAISDANRRLHDLERERQAVGATLAALESERGVLAAKVRGEQVLLAQMLARRQAGSEQDPLRLILSGRDPGAISRLLHYYRVIAEARARAITGLRADIVRAHDLALSGEAQRRQLDGLAREELAQRSVLERERRSQAQVLARAGADIRRQQQELARAKRDDARLARLLERLAELTRGPAAPATEPPAAAAGAALGSGLSRGGATMPVRGELTGRFGAPRQGGGTASKGWFIRCPQGEEVRAIAAGQVVYADWLRGFGNLLIVDHGEGYMSLYGNNDALLATVGAVVGKGEAIAQAGASGGGPEPGLYFEVRHQGTAVDPAPWIGR